ncbi:class I SAM-dependent methyltransferase [Roseomonas sp. PWR1]|uniref:Class I SAM-dependent methyltransferase n=1 Tax=Roseomonas nitratireducens TaxID=2820810 RepID=A0ABS4ANY4_9PROT|nr:class I SAM-dependent methyltransferase [Neoroseomonas nitratireducens]MBP0462568.1 class I SAM-dependent methyltransferase [Neoroseomonas nitratireducens]
MTDDVPRFGFGDNWNKFIRQKHNAERLNAASKRLTSFLNREDMKGLDFLDIGCGSGLHSMAALTLGAGKVHSFDYDPNSVKATQFLREKAGNPPNWKVERGDVLDPAYMESLGKWNFVYSWGVLHHTGAMWDAVRNAQARVADGGLFYIALYSADVDLQPSKEFWLEIKKEYNRVTPFTRWLMMWWYVWRFGISMNVRNVPALVKQIWTHRTKRGMNYFTDVRDWIGGWPMEYAGDQETADFLEDQYGFELINVSVGHACSEFLFRKTGVLGRKTDVKQLVEKLKTEKAYTVV